MQRYNNNDEVEEEVLEDLMEKANEKLKKEDLKDFKDKALEAGEVAAALKLKKETKAIAGQIEKFLFSLETEEKIYAYQPEENIDSNIKEILESEKIEKLIYEKNHEIIKLIFEG